MSHLCRSAILRCYRRVRLAYFMYYLRRALLNALSHLSARRKMHYPTLHQYLTRIEH